MADDHGVGPTQVHWHTSTLDHGVKHERLALDPQKDLRITPIADGETQQDLFLLGQIDGLLAPTPPFAVMSGAPRIERVYPDFETLEQEWHRLIGYFLIIHVIALRRSLAEALPWVAQAQSDACQQDRVIAMDRLRDVWLGLACLAEMNLWNGPAPPGEPIPGPYGFRHAQLKIAALCRYSVDRFQASRLVAPEELFETSLLKT